MPRSKTTKETGLAKAKQFYNEQLAKRGTAVKGGGPRSLASTKSTSLSTQPHSETESHQITLEQAQLRKINASGFRKNDSKIHHTDINRFQYCENELALTSNRNHAVLQGNGGSVDINETLGEPDDIPLLVHEADNSHHARNKEQPAIQTRAKTEKNLNCTSQSLNKSSTTKSIYVKSLLMEGSLVVPWTVGLVFSLLAIRFEKPILSFIESLRCFMWELMRAGILATLLAMGIHLIVWLVRHIRALQYTRHLQFRQQVLNVKMHVHKILRSDPDIGVTVASLREQLTANMKRRTSDKVWNRVVSDIRADYRVAKFVADDGVIGVEEEVWQWQDAPPAKPRDANRLRRVVILRKPCENTKLEAEA